MIKVLIVDDHEVVRLGLTGLVGRDPEYRVVGEAGGVAECLDKVAELRPDVVVLDVRLPDGSGIDACREIVSAWPDTKVLMLTSFPDREAVLASVMAGASGYLMKHANGAELLAAIKRVARGESLLDPQVVGEVMGELRALAGGERRPASPEPVLTPQEQRIIAMVAQGDTNREIGLRLSLTEGTVRNYVSAILQKLNLRSRSQAAAYLTRRERDT